jgi:hypothetical protein
MIWSFPETVRRLKSNEPKISREGRDGLSADR